MVELEHFPFNCGIGILGEFLELNPANYAFTAEKKAEYARLLAEWTPKTQAQIEQQIDYNQAGGEDDDGAEIVPRKVYIATTSERQTPAIQALKNLGFRPLATWRGNEGKITLWLKKREDL